MEFLFLDQAGELVKETLPHVLSKCGIDDLVIRQSMKWTGLSGAAIAA